MVRPTVKEIVWYGFDHARVKQKYEGEPEFIREFSIGGPTWAVYRVAKPNRKKNHKDFMMLRRIPFGGGEVSGLDKLQMNKYRYQTALLCKECNQIVYSVNRHDCHTCECPNQTEVDGGKAYLHYSSNNNKKVEIVTLDLLTGKLTKRSPSKS